jgi:hypothetical protein
MGPKAFDLKAVKSVYGGWVAEVGVLIPLFFVISLLEVFSPSSDPLGLGQKEKSHKEIR